LISSVPGISRTISPSHALDFSPHPHVRNLTKSPIFTYNLQQILPMRHRTRDTIPPNYSGWYNSMMNFYHDAHAATSGGHFASVSYQVTDLHL
jgi:hypothetical protein